MYQELGVNALVGIAMDVLFVLVSFRLLFALRFDKLLKPNHVWESQLLMIFVAITLGVTVSGFFQSLISNSLRLTYLFK